MAGVTNTENEERGTGVWELVYSGDPLHKSNGGQNRREGSTRNKLGKREFLSAVPPDDQYVLVRAESD